MSSKKLNIVETLNDLPTGVTFPDGYVAIDCEMMGLNYLRDRLCLCQIGDGQGNVWLVKFDGNEWSAPNLKKILTDEKLIKILHFGRYDLTSLKHYLGVMTAPVFDTKIASRMARTYGAHHGLKALIEEVIQEKVSKEQQTSNWGAEVLTDKQKEYAANDVIYLHRIRTELQEMLEREGRWELTQKCFDFLPTRVEIDLAGWDEKWDVFAH